MNDEQKLAYLVGQYDNWKTYRQKNYDSVFIEVYKLYKCFRNREVSNWQSNVFLPYVFSVIETVFPRIMEYVYQGDEFVRALPRGMEDYNQAEIVDKLIQYQIDTQIQNLFLELAEHFKTCLIYGNGIGKLTWNVKENRPEFFNIDIFDFVVEPYKKHIETMDGMYQVYDKFVDQLFQLQQEGLAGHKNVGKLFSTSQTKESEPDKQQKNSEVGKSSKSQNKRNSALIYEFWGKVPIQDRIDLDAGFSAAKYEEKLVLIANRKHLIREVPNPYITSYNPDGFKPFIASKNYIDPQEFYSMGEIYPIRDLQHEANELENNMLDNLKIIINRMWQVTHTAGIDLDTLYSYPGAIFQTNELDQLRPIDHRDIPPSYFESRQHRLQDIDKATGVYDYTRGANTPGMTDTVGGITSLIEEANMRFGVKIKVLQMTSITEFARKLFMLDKIFIRGADFPVRIANEEGYGWITISEDNLAGMYDFKPIGVSMLGNKLARQNALIRLGELFSKFPPIPPLAEQILKEYDMKNTDQVMSYLRMMWGMPVEGAGAPPIPAGTRGQGIPLPSSIAAGNPQVMPNTDAELNQNLGKQLAAGMR
jgi:hypothetical protein